MNRRHFILGLAAGTLAKAQAQDPPSPKSNLCIFTKGLQSLSYEALAEKIASIDHASGIEATIRKGGHIEPEQVPDELPKMVEALRKRNLEITVMASSINDASDPSTEQTLRVAAQLGIKRYRLQYYRYTNDRSIKANTANGRPS